MAAGDVTSEAGQRFIEFERCFNFRDLGGYTGLEGLTLRWRKLYRAMTPEFFSERDRQAGSELGIGLVVDLRGPQFKTSGPLGESPARRVAPGRRRKAGLTDAQLQNYVALAPEEALPIVLGTMGRVYARTAALISQEEGPVLVHCRLGKDRTGVFAAVLLRLLGAAEEDVIQDYLLSACVLDDAHRLLAASEGPNQHGNHSRVAMEPPNPDAMQAVLRRLRDEYGGAEAYLRRHGLRKREVADLINRLLE